MNHLCKFSCKYGHCPEDVCTERIDGPDMSGPPDYPFDYKEHLRQKNARKCFIYKEPENAEHQKKGCNSFCSKELEEAKSEGRTTSAICVGFWPLDQPIPWMNIGPGMTVASGTCHCDNQLVNELTAIVIEAMPIIAQIGCYIMMSTLKLVIEIGAEFIPVVGQPISVALDAANTAAQLATYLYPKEEDPEGAFSWWLKPCGGTNLVPEDIKRVFEILSNSPNGRDRFNRQQKSPNLQQGSGKKGDGSNPTDRAAPSNNRVQKNTQKCRVPPAKATMRIGAAKNTLRFRKCVNSETHTNELIITSLVYEANAKPTQIARECSQAWSQACFHYSSAIRVNPQWATLTCPPEVATTADRRDLPATQKWTDQHNGAGWKDEVHKAYSDVCDRDEYPPAYLLGPKDPASQNSGLNRQGQLVRLIPNSENRAAGKMWQGVCFGSIIKDIPNSDFVKKVAAAQPRRIETTGLLTKTSAAVTVPLRPEFTITKWGHAGNPPQNDGLNVNPCWPTAAAAADPGFNLLAYDPFYDHNPRPYNYRAPYVKGQNGS
ncbi:hypothetical protein LZ32DRAFT_50225 [Colletotrichum eremochloae]|nr:hypothetical protein LZ32DRAFT_50225 [Colletotrichum eremochloae]